MTLSTNSAHRMLPNASHGMVTADETTAHQSSQVILDVVDSERNHSQVSAEHG